MIFFHIREKLYESLTFNKYIEILSLLCIYFIYLKQNKLELF